MLNLTEVRQAVEKHRDMIFQAERQIWRNPETGFREWKTHTYLVEKMEALGYTLVQAGDIPGFYADVDTGRPGPHLLLMAELDSVIVPGHPECDKSTGAVHACGHNCQCAALLGVAAALKEPGILEGLSGKIRLMFEPAEELVELGYRNQLIEQGTLSFFGGKQEFLARGYMDGMDLAIHMHTIWGRSGIMRASLGSNGNIKKLITFTGKTCHAGGPADGINALMASTLALDAINAIRETFRERDYIRYNTVVTGRVCGANQIPDCVIMEGTLRAATEKALIYENKRINRCLAAAAAAVGAQVHVEDTPGYTPLHCDDGFRQVADHVMENLVGRENVYQPGTGDTSCTDVGDVASVMPVLEAFTSGLTGVMHGDDLYVTDQESAAVLPAVFQMAMIQTLLKEDAAEARRIVEAYEPLYPSIAAYVVAKTSMHRSEDLVQYDPDGSIRLVVE